MNNPHKITPVEQQRLIRLAGQRARLQKEALNIFRPTPNQVDIFKSEASELLLRGGNRSGKSVCAAMLFASAATGIPVKDPDGNPIPIFEPHRLAHHHKRGMTMWCVGLGEKHIGQTLHRLLFQRDLFKMIRDDDSGEWRSFDPVADKGREWETRPSPPAIPKRFIEAWGWKDKSKRLFESCRLTNGTTIYAYTSIADAKMGDPVDFIWIDENIRFGAHYAEWQARISDRKGRIAWSVWPGHGSWVVQDISERAKVQRDEKREKLDVEEVVLTFSSNKFIDADEKRKRLEGWSEDDRRSRDEGEFTYGKSRIYPTFAESTHGTPSRYEAEWDLVDKVMDKNNGMPPSDWCRGLVVDPGHSHPGILFVAIAPPDLCPNGPVWVVYDELYQPQTDADEQAKGVSLKPAAPYMYFVMDAHAGRTTPMGFNITVRDRYEEAFAQYKLRCETTQGSFRMGNDNVEAGIGAVRGALHIGEGGRPKLRVVIAKCPWFIKQMTMYRKLIDLKTNMPVDEPAKRQIDPLVDCIRYWCAGNYQYMSPPRNTAKASGALEYFRNEFVDEESQPKNDSIYCGAGVIEK
jgi:hypothetical protein